MIQSVATALEQLWDLTRANGQRLRVIREHPVATDETIFILEVADNHRHPLIHVRTRNLESAAQWILDHKDSRR